MTTIVSLCMQQKVVISLLIPFVRGNTSNPLCIYLYTHTVILNRMWEWKIHRDLCLTSILGNIIWPKKFECGLILQLPAAASLTPLWWIQELKFLQICMLLKFVSWDPGQKIWWLFLAHTFHHWNFGLSSQTDNSNSTFLINVFLLMWHPIKLLDRTLFANSNNLFNYWDSTCFRLLSPYQTSIVSVYKLGKLIHRKWAKRLSPIV